MSIDSDLQFATTALTFATALATFVQGLRNGAAAKRNADKIEDVGKRNSEKIDAVHDSLNGHLEKVLEARQEVGRTLGLQESRDKLADKP
jgi:hypothetical protein